MAMPPVGIERAKSAVRGRVRPALLQQQGGMAPQQWQRAWV